MVQTDLWQRLIEKRQADGQALRPGVSAADIAAFEQRYGVVMPADVRACFAAADGQADMGDDLFRFWPLAEVKPAHEELSAADADGTDVHPDRFDYPDYFVFADYLIWSWGYAVRIGGGPEASGPVICLTGGGHDRQVSASFAGFIEEYVTDPHSVAP